MNYRTDGRQYSYSIVIPVHVSHWQYLPDLVQSVSLWSRPPLEIICCLSGVGMRRIGRFKKEIGAPSSPGHLSLSLTRRPRTAGQNRNLGARRASGDYILFMDADDVYASDYGAQLMAIVDEFQTDLVMHSFANSDAAADELARPGVSINEDLFEGAEELLKAAGFDNRSLPLIGPPLHPAAGFSIHHGVLAVKRTVFTDIEYSNRRMGQDVEFIRRCIRHDKTLTITSRKLMVWQTNHSSNRRLSRRLYRKSMSAAVGVRNFVRSVFTKRTVRRVKGPHN